MTIALFKKLKKPQKEIHDETVGLLDDAIAQLENSIANLERVRSQALALKEEHEEEMGDD